MSRMNNQQKAKCHAIIHSASASACAVGVRLAQIPCNDNAVITPKLVMSVSLGRVFVIELTDNAATAASIAEAIEWLLAEDFASQAYVAA